MTPLAKFVDFLMFAAALAVSGFAAELPSFEFIGTVPGKNEKAALVFEVTKTSQFIGDNLHTVFVVNAVVIKSGFKELKQGTTFEGYFDRFYSIFDAPSEHPLKAGDRVEVGVTQIDKQTISGFLKGKKSANQAPEPTPTAVTPPAGQEARQP